MPRHPLYALIFLDVAEPACTENNPRNIVYFLVFLINTPNIRNFKKLNNQKYINYLAPLYQLEIRNKKILLIRITRFTITCNFISYSQC